MELIQDDARLLLRLYAAHSALYALNTTLGISSYLEKLLITIPGVSDCEVCLLDASKADKKLNSRLIGLIPLRIKEFNVYDIEANFIAQQKHEFEIYPIRTSSSFYGLIIVKIIDNKQFERFDSVINTFAASVSFILENIIQREHLNEIVKSKTQSLDIAFKKLEKYTDELKEANRELQQYAHITSHEIQEPLRMISSYLQLLEKRYKNKLDKDADEYIQFAVNGAKRLHDMLIDLYNYALIESRGESFEDTDCNDVFKAVETNLKKEIDAADAYITCDHLPVVKADKNQLIKLFQNLISNAIKFHKPDEQPIIHVSATREENEWVFSIKDNGIGIDPKYHDQLFMVFKRLVSKEYLGTGIGLASCKRIVERHKGRIWLDSEANQGATFFFSMPIKQDVIAG